MGSGEERNRTLGIRGKVLTSFNIPVIGDSEGKGKKNEVEKKFEEIRAKNFVSKIYKFTDLKYQQIPNRKKQRLHTGTRHSNC